MHDIYNLIFNMYKNKETYLSTFYLQNIVYYKKFT